MHLPHPEELPWLQGFAGVRAAVDALNDVPATATVKWDGSPAIVTGHDTDGFFLATKSYFNKRGPKVNRSHADIWLNHGQNAELCEILDRCMTYVPALDIRDAWMGDVLYTGTIATEHIDGDLYYAFQPNIIQYLVHAESDAGRALWAAPIGVVFHTLIGPQTQPFVTSPTPYVWMPPDAWRVPHLKSFDIDFTAVRRFTEELRPHADVIDLWVQTGISDLLRQFDNSLIRTGERFHPLDRAKHALRWLADKKRPLDAHLVLPVLRLLYQWQDAVVAVKTSYLRNVQLPAELRMRYRTPDYEAVTTSHEGLVAKTIKLVDRYSFSRANFAAHV